MARARNERPKQLTYKGFTIASWSPFPSHYSATVLEGRFNNAQGGSRTKVIKQLKDAITKHLTNGAPRV